MEDLAPPLMTPTGEDPAKRSLVDDVKQLASDGRTLVEAEFAYQKSRAVVAGAGLKGVTAWGALAAAFVFFALLALVFGLILGLSELVGPWAATGLVVTALLAAAALSAMAAGRRWRRMSKLLGDGDTADELE